MNTYQQSKKLGTFLGVFTPTVLTILGVIMYLRVGWLVGHMGLYRIIIIVILANAITLITTLSFSSVATNIRVGIGGAYYIISRSLGLEIGGAIGLPLFLSQAFSVTLYSYGLAESLRFVWPDIPLQAATFIIVLAVGLLSMAGAKIALKVQIPVLFFIMVSLIALAIGCMAHAWGKPFPVDVHSGEVGFWAGFAIFFPAVTGVMAGLGLSGDLRDPGRSIPVGAIAAVLTGFVVYLVVPILLFAGISVSVLRENVLAWLTVAPLGPWLVLPGLWGAIFSSAVGSMLGAPRTLQALAKDHLAPGFLGRATGDRRELLPGLILSLAIALGAVFLGDLNAVAAVVTVFFLTTYGMINIVAALETLSGDTSWRPKLKIPWPVNLLGGIACIAVIFLINAIAGMIAIVVELAIWLLLSKRHGTARWGDARRGIYESLIRWALLRLAHRPMSARNWRPHVLVFVSDPVHHLDLVRFGNWFSQERGIVTVCHFAVGDLLTEEIDVMARQDQIQTLLDDEGLSVFAEFSLVDSIVEGITNVAQANGLAGIQSNTILVGWPNERHLFVDFLKVMQRLEKLKKSFIIGRINPRYLFPREGVERTIHVWWGGLKQNGDLMLLLAYLLTLNPEWSESRIEIMSVASSELAKSATERYLERLLPEIRIKADTKVFLRSPDKSIRDLIHEESCNAEVVIFGLAIPEPGEEDTYAQRLEDLAGDLPVVFFVKNSCVFIGELLHPDNDNNMKTGIAAVEEANGEN
ncbi:MAG: Na-K-Cl cotransporter [Deltaproteobacteria bacterium]|nr:Na-K-Cl cotransporter [Deltaproteobacteria bacterium]MBN2688179.1 Na-K-Cl cotransporter [Deltaproteobacteria bacterium]